ncbi:hypothetical protein B296_00015833 [Ensete ventricosum]|uniref:Uncharacterized protein n=1 Tax=Ensete ventricosum TaxID=4639 RepID=A0A426Y6P6_ENSVE|nr:hypothetical protein B296_00015833 [Ensete ventricosum]
MMLPLRFPNSSIRAKQRQQGKEAVGHGQDLCNGDRPRSGPLQERSAAAKVASKGSHTGSDPRPTYKGRCLLVTRLRGSACPRLARKGQRLPAASRQRGDAHKGTAYGHGACPPARCRSRATTLAAGATANGTDCYRLHNDHGRRKGATRTRVSSFWKRIVLPL